MGREGTNQKADLLKVTRGSWWNLPFALLNRFTQHHRSHHEEPNHHNHQQEWRFRHKLPSRLKLCPHGSPLDSTVQFVCGIFVVLDVGWRDPREMWKQDLPSSSPPINQQGWIGQSEEEEEEVEEGVELQKKKKKRNAPSIFHQENASQPKSALWRPPDWSQFSPIIIINICVPF